MIFLIIGTASVSSEDVLMEYSVSVKASTKVTVANRIIINHFAVRVKSGSL